MNSRMLAVAFAAAALSACNTAKSPTQPQFSGDRIKADVAFLADDRLEGRYTGSPGHEIAARYVAARFAALGLKPAANGDWYQQVPLLKGERRTDAPSAIRIDGQSFPNGKDVSFRASTRAPDQKVAAEAVFVGYGLDAPEIGSRDYDGVDVRGKVAIALWGYPKGAPSEVAAHLLSQKAKMAKEHGAIGLLSIATPVLEEVAPWEYIAARADEPIVTLDDREPALSFGGYLHPRAAEILFRGAPVPLAMLLAESTKEGAKPKGFALNKSITVEDHEKVQPLRSPNVVAVLPGSDPRLRDEYIVLTAHLDHIGRIKPENGDSIANGAMDNAMGVSVLLEAARAFVESGTVPKRSILFAAVTGEEEGLLGADYLSKHPVVGRGKVVGAVNLDMPIVTYDFEDVVAYGADHSTIAKAVEKAIASRDIKLSPDPAPEQVSFVRSDHYPFVKAGVPAVSLDLGPAGPGAAATKEFLDKHYHRVSDDMSLPFNWGAAAKFALLNYLIARQLADDEEPPRWYEGDYFGEHFATADPKVRR